MYKRFIRPHFLVRGTQSTSQEIMGLGYGYLCHENRIDSFINESR